MSKLNLTVHSKRGILPLPSLLPPSFFLSFCLLSLPPLFLLTFFYKQLVAVHLIFAVVMDSVPVVAAPASVDGNSHFVRIVLQAIMVSTVI